MQRTHAVVIIFACILVHTKLKSLKRISSNEPALPIDKIYANKMCLVQRNTETQEIYPPKDDEKKKSNHWCSLVEQFKSKSNNGELFCGMSLTICSQCVRNNSEYESEKFLIFNNNKITTNNIELE